MVGRLAVVAAIGSFVGLLHAADQPLPGKRITLERKAAKEKLIFELKDPGILLPAAGSADDPSLVGLRVQLFGGRLQDTAELIAPAGLGKPGWVVKTGSSTRYTYANTSAPGGPSPIRSIKIVQGKGIKIMGRLAGLALEEQQLSVGVRIEMGSTRLCTIFVGESIRRDETGSFIARDAALPPFSTCGDEPLYGIPCEFGTTCEGICEGGAQCGGVPGFGCECASPSQPCGDTDPVCNGQCPTGEECGQISGAPFPSCGCLPAGSTACGEAYPTCGNGDCPAGTQCYATTFTCCGGIDINSCSCLSEPPPPPCGGCPTGWTCVGPPVFTTPFCLPPLCDGGPGVCGGSCPAGTTCTSFGSACLCLETCSGGSPYPACGGTCATPGTTCQATAATGSCTCGDD